MALGIRQIGMNESSPSFLEQSRAKQIIIGNVICQSVGTLFVLARVYSRLGIIKFWKAEDWTLVVALLFATGYSIGAYGQVAHGAGHHIGALTNYEDAITSQKYAFLNNLLVFFAIALPKASIFFTYLRLFYFDVVGHRLIQGLLVLLVLLIVPFVIETCFTCKPLSAYWTSLSHEECLRDIATLYVSGGMNVMVDIVLMAFLIPRILRMTMNRRQKGVLLGIVSLESVAVMAGITRMVRIGKALDKYGSGTFDPPWDTYDVTIWTSTEIYVSLICAAAPGTKPLISLLLPRLLGTTLQSRIRSSIDISTGTGTVDLSGKTALGTVTTKDSKYRSNSVAGLPAMAENGPSDEESLRMTGSGFSSAGRTVETQEISVVEALADAPISPRSYPPEELSRAQHTVR